MTDSDQPLFSPAAFELMSALVLTPGLTRNELAAQCKQSAAELQDTLRLLAAEDYVADAVEPDASAPAYRATAKGRLALSEQISWMKRRITDRE